MMRKLWVPVLGIAVIALVAAAVGVASASNDRERGRVETIVIEGAGDQFTEGRVEGSPMDLGVPGLSQGDRFVFNDDLYIDGERVGFDGGECIVVRKGDAPGASSIMCLHTFVLPDGQIIGQGIFTEDAVNGFQREIFAITGGTGRYAGVRGEFVDERTSPTSFRYTLHLTYAGR